MVRRRSRPSKGARTAGRLLRLLGLSGTGTAAVVLLVISLLMIGSDYTKTAARESDCQLSDVVGGAGLEVFGDSVLAGLAEDLPATMFGGAVHNDVKSDRTTEQAVNELSALPDSAPGVFVVSLEQDDPGEAASYTNQIEELALLLSDRTVLWVTVPGKDTLNRIVAGENTGDTGDWRIVDFAQAVPSHPQWWTSHGPTRAGSAALAQTVSAALATSQDSTNPIDVGTGSPITVVSRTTGETFVVSGDRKRNAESIITTGLGLHVPQRGLVIGIAVAIQESRLVNLTGGDQDSLGLFQQRPSQGWGTATEILNPRYAATQFFGRLLQVPGWQQMALTDAAQAVQRSGTPDAYAQWETAATTIAAALQGAHAPGCGPQDPTTGSPKAQVAIQAAKSQLGVPYAWGGGDINGPTVGVCTPGAGSNDCHIVGFDCSGLMLYAWGKAGVAVPHYTVDMWSDPAFTHISDQSQLQPGDMILFQENGVPAHTGMYLGHDEMIHAPQSGDVVKIVSLHSPWNQQHYLGAIRPKA